MKTTVALIALICLTSCQNIGGISVRGRYGDYAVDRDGVVTITPRFVITDGK